MKKIIALLICVVTFAAYVNAQTPASRTYYVEIYEVSILGMKSVSMDFGVDAPAGMVYKITDQNKQNIDFKNIVAALNYMNSNGWEVVTVYDRNSPKAGTRTVYLLKLDGAAHPENEIAKTIDGYIADIKNK